MTTRISRRPIALLAGLAALGALTACGSQPLLSAEKSAHVQAPTEKSALPAEKSAHPFIPTEKSALPAEKSAHPFIPTEKSARPEAKTAPIG
jgi:hypothetical protein